MPTLVERLLDCGAVKFGDFTLTSGAKSPYYVDVKQAMTDPETLRAIAQDMARTVEALGPFDAVAGMELGAVPLATAVSLETDLPMLILRKGERSHGTGRRIEGRDPEGLSVLVVEDVTSTGGSTVQAVQALRDAGAEVGHALVVVDRDSGATDALAAAHVELHPLVSAAELLDSPQAKEALA